MRKSAVFVIGFVFLFSFFALVWFLRKPSKVEESSKIEGGKASQNLYMKLKSSAFENNTMIPQKYTCDGENISPPLQIEGVPEGTQSLVLIVDDPDAPMGDWVHWLVWNIKADTKEIAEGQVPEGSFQGTNDFGRLDYGGPCPPSGTHRYFFKLYALDTTVNLAEGARKKDLESAIEGHVLEQTSLVGLYKRI